MKIIDLLNKIAKGEEVPKRIKYFGLVYEHCDRCKQYEHNDVGVNIKLFEEIVDLTDTVEILDDEEKRLPNKLDYCEENTFMNKKETTYLSSEERRLLDSNFKFLCDKYNEIIDYLEKQRKGE